MAEGSQYCLVEGTVPTPKQGLTLGGLLGVCRPSACDQHEVKAEVESLTNQSGLKNIEVSCRRLGQPQPNLIMTTGQKAALALIIIIIGLLIAGTALSWHKKRNGHQPPSGPALPMQTGGFASNCRQKLLSLGTVTLEAFSLSRNVKSFTKIRSEEKDSSGAPSLKVLDGLRVLSMLWVVLGHTLLWPLISVQYDNTFMLLPPKGRMTEVWFQIIPGGYFAVDTFFWLSGFLGAYTMHSKVKKSPELLSVKGFCLKLYPMGLFSRWLRLSAAYAFVLLISQTWFRELGRGSLLWNARFQPVKGSGGCFFSIDTDECKQGWWKNLLYINNLSEKGLGCLGHTWYLACDMQMFLVLPFVVLCRERCGEVAGWSFLSLLTLSSVIANFRVMMEKNEVSDPVLGGLGHGHFMQDVYESTPMRIQPYLVGVATAWLMELFDARRRTRIADESTAENDADRMAASSMAMTGSLGARTGDSDDPVTLAAGAAGSTAAVVAADLPQTGALNGLDRRPQLNSCQVAPAPTLLVPGGSSIRSFSMKEKTKSEELRDMTSIEVDEENGEARPRLETRGEFSGRVPLLVTDESAARSGNLQISIGSCGITLMALTIQVLSLALMAFVVVIQVTRYRCSTLQECVMLDKAPWSKTANALYPALSHLAWAVGLASLMLLCFFDAPGTWWLNASLGDKFWQAPAKLTFLAYLIHPLVLVFFYCVRDSAVHYEDATFFLNYLALSVIVFVLSFFIWVAVEKPSANLTAAFLSVLTGRRGREGGSI
eukprot:TRINITY_DN27024_c0_g1_i1.p1 TRINITY_DN27024_c0_g1~~TRINITY_DN27024_c0_g1_i1.p1  ORF type:complete len:876 (-),score=149.40 TRINITY_DN27024_c0_g1_i1:125-2431(-)